MLSDNASCPYGCSRLHGEMKSATSSMLTNVLQKVAEKYGISKTPLHEILVKIS